MFAYDRAAVFSKRYIAALSKINPGIKMIIVGSIRRHAPIVNDIDILCLDVMPTKFPPGYEILASGPKTTRLYYKKDKIKVDIFCVPKSAKIFAMLHYTGPKEMNIVLRKLAMKKGYKLNQYGLFTKSGKMINVKSEREIFDLLGHKYISISGRDKKFAK